MFWKNGKLTVSVSNYFPCIEKMTKIPTFMVHSIKKVIQEQLFKEKTYIIVIQF